MLRASIGFFIFALIAFALGANGVGGVSADVGRLLLFVFLALAVLSFLGSLLSGRGMKTPTLMTVFVVASAFTVTSLSFAEETTTEKVENTAGDVKRDAKKSGRKFKRKVRKATGNDSVVEDAKDGLNNTGDAIGNAADKAKNKVD